MLDYQLSFVDPKAATSRWTKNFDIASITHLPLQILYPSNHSVNRFGCILRCLRARLFTFNEVTDGNLDCTELSLDVLLRRAEDFSVVLVGYSSEWLLKEHYTVDI